MKFRNITPLPEPDALLTPMLLSEGVPHIQVTATHHEPRMEGDEEYVFAPHPLQSSLSIDNAVAVKVLFDTPESNVLARYEAWGPSTGMGPVCIGNGEVAKALNTNNLTYEQVSCRGPELCPAVREKKVQCSPAVRLMVRPVANPNLLLQMRCASASAYRALLSDLQRAKAEHGGLRGLSFMLNVQRKSSMASGYESFAVPRLRASCDHADAVPASNPQWEEYGNAIADAWNSESLVVEADLAAFKSHTSLDPQVLSSGSTRVQRQHQENSAAAAVDDLVSTVLGRASALTPK